MHALSAGELLEVWESGLAQAPTERALGLLAAAWPEVSRDAWAALTIGQRDGRLLTLRQELWGPLMSAVVVCPGCRERLELTLDVRELLSNSQPELPREIPLSIGEYELIFRLPTVPDLQDFVGQRALYLPEAHLLGRCVLSAQRGGAPIEADKLRGGGESWARCGRGRGLPPETVRERA